MDERLQAIADTATPFEELVLSSADYGLTASQWGLKLTHLPCGRETYPFGEQTRGRLADVLVEVARHRKSTPSCR